MNGWPLQERSFAWSCQWERRKKKKKKEKKSVIHPSEVWLIAKHCWNYYGSTSSNFSGTRLSHTHAQTHVDDVLTSYANFTNIINLTRHMSFSLTHVDHGLYLVHAELCVPAQDLRHHILHNVHPVLLRERKDGGGGGKRGSRYTVSFIIISCRVNKNIFDFTWMCLRTIAFSPSKTKIFSQHI